MKLAMLHYSNSIIDFNRLFGMQVSEINTLNKLLERGIGATLYTRQLIGEHKYIKELAYGNYDKILHDSPFYTRFIDAAADADILQGNATPLLAVYRPEKTIIRINGHFDFPFDDQYQFQERYNQAYYLFVSEYMRDEYIRKYPFLSRDHCFVVHNAVDILDEPHKEVGEKVKMVFASRWVAQKGLDVLLRAIKMLQKKRLDFQLYIAGGIHTTGKEGNKTKQLENRVKAKFEKLKNVHVLGYMQPENLLKFFEKMDLLLFPSVWGEPFSSMPLQAAVAKVPTIGFYDGSLAEGVVHGQTGVLLRKSKYERINAYRYYKALNHLLDRRENIERMGIEARKQTMNKFNWDVHINKLLEIYNTMLTH